MSHLKCKCEMHVAAIRKWLLRSLTAASWGAAQQTGGSYTVALDERHLEELVRQHAPPPPTAAASTAASMVSAPRVTNETGVLYGKSHDDSPSVFSEGRQLGQLPPPQPRQKCAPAP